MLAAQQLSIPVWTWVFFALVLLMVLVVLGLGLRKFGGSQAEHRARRSATGLTPEQRAFQEEMRLMLEARTQQRLEREVRQEADPPAAAGSDEAGSAATSG